MKSIIKNGENFAKEYPCLKRYTHGDTDKVVLFTSMMKGVTVYSNKKEDIGSEAGSKDSGWAEEQFTPFNGTIELSNN